MHRDAIDFFAILLDDEMLAPFPDGTARFLEVENRTIIGLGDDSGYG
jgi:hypothetical protein